MKTRILLIAFCALSMCYPASAQGQKGLYIHSIKGQVLYRSSSENTWHAPTVRQTVSRLDSLQIGANSEVVLIDGSNDNVYSCSTPTKDNVLHLVRSARSKANTLLGSVAQQLRDNAAGNGTGKQVVVAGMTTRGDDDEDTMHDSIACLALQTAQRYIAGEQVYDASLKWQRIEQEGLVHFAIENGSEEAYCVNILALDQRTQRISLCIVPSPEVDITALVVPAGKTLELSMYRFVANEALQYTLFATKTAYAPTTVQHLLRYPEDIKCE